MPTFEDVPNELLYEITKLVCVSQEAYWACLLVNRRFHTVVEGDMLPQIAIHVRPEQLQSFYDTLKRLNIGPRLKYLWINGRSTQADQVIECIRACPNIIALACSKVALLALCTPSEEGAEFKHTSLTNLSLFGSWGLWLGLRKNEAYRHAVQLCSQITHLRLHDPLMRDFSRRMFPSLTHVATALPLGGLGGTDQVDILMTMDKLQVIRLSTNYYFVNADKLNRRTKELLDKDPRVALVCMPHPADLSECDLWCGMAQGTPTIWTLESEGINVII